jgi:hypothetical protein
VIIKELLVALGFDLDKDAQKKVDSFNEQLKDTAKFMGKVVLTSGAAAAAIVAYVSKVSQGVDELGKSAEKMGEQVEELDALRHAAEIATGSGDGLISSMENLNLIMAQAAIGTGSGVAAFGRLGLSVTDSSKRLKKATTFIHEIAEAIKQFSGNRAIQLDLIQQMGLGGLENLVLQGRFELAKLIAEAKALGVVTTEDAARAAGFNDMMTRVFRTIKHLGIFLAAKLEPIASKIMGGVSAFVPVAMRWIRWVEQLVSLLGGLDVVLRAIVITISIILAFGLGKMVMVMISLVGALTGVIQGAGAAALLASAKLVLIGGMIMFIALLVEDIATTLKGGDGLLDRWVKKFPIIERVLRPVAETLLLAENSLKAVWKLLQDPLSSDSWLEFFDDLLAEFKRFLGEMNEAIGDLLLPDVDGKSQSVTEFAGRKFSEITGFGELKEALISSLVGSIPASFGGGVGSMVTSTVNGAPITVNVTNPNATAEDIASKVSQAVQEQNRQALLNVTKGVKQ